VEQGNIDSATMERMLEVSINLEYNEVVNEAMVEEELAEYVEAEIQSMRQSGPLTSNEDDVVEVEDEETDDDPDTLDLNEEEREPTITSLVQAENALDEVKRYAEANNVPKEEFNKLYMRMTRLLRDTAAKNPKSQVSLCRFFNTK